MLRVKAVSAIYIESQALELLSAARRDVYKLFRTSSLSTQAPSSQTVLTSSRGDSDGAPPGARSPPPRSPPPPPPPPPPRRSWLLTATAVTVTASLGGVYFYRKLSEDNESQPAVQPEPSAASAASEPEPIPSSGEDIPRRVQFLLVGAGTASFAAMRAIRSARPDARVLLVGAEPELPYMRPPLSKELWREPDLATRAPHLDALSFRQWNGRRRSVAYEPPAFYTPVASLPDSAGGAAVARGWRVVRLDAVRHEAELRAPGREPVRVHYDKCLVATGVRARRSEALREAAAAGRALALRGVRDAARLAQELERPGVRRVAVLGGGFLASELSAALAERLLADGREVLQLFRERAPLAGVLPPYLAQEAARRLREAGVALRPAAEVVAAAPDARGVALRLASGEELRADLVVECVGSEVDEELARASELETHPELGGLLVNAELQARTDVYAAGDVACFYDVVLGRRRVEHHDHAVVSGRLAGENMAGVAPPKHYTHQSMFWSDLGPQLGYEAIGIIDSRLPTVGVFSADAVTDTAAAAGAVAGEGGAVAGEAGAVAGAVAGEAGALRPVAAASDAGGAAEADAAARRYERGVVFYLRERRVVGVLLWNLFNRMHVARQVLAQGEFDDLFEVAKLFSLHEDD
ncbi:apoptosis-inducing factor 1, mitochondrial-like isoform X1 [Helicoverpa zea]|uniref:apoptosis-inducing factor 1, mitochondrial-like isoform X1 n=1 Tax=Helicoverpa zea TaxID=7113 RepID=UPI001F59EB8B|nr:apoptosis-inducing factor 1, mitochondrial-like isoform X1 [Helicoverpa zea]